ncbi:MAG TPA: glutamine--fructose-6-phosphate transaminase (isomerizing), partial [Acidobacteria bacterium]|nr:glutamine--fructose-6-phosphate transaminase (isomerizing) [Acidobacteriota bacterium]
MCGIIGYIGDKPVVPVLIEGLRRLEYRGYDSAGIALAGDGLEIRRSAGKLARLEEVIAAQPVDGDYGLGHTRWATHGRPTEENAHPHRDCTGRIVVVHNGIIENYLDLKHELEADGHLFQTETDTEVIAHLVEREMRDDGLECAVRRALVAVKGLFGLVLLSADDPQKLVAVRNGPPILVGLGDQEFFVASDVPAILSHTRNVVFLGDQEVAVITRAGVEFTDFDGAAVQTTTQRITWDPVMAEKAGYKHFMLKEIFEQPWAVQETVLGRASLESGQVFLGELEIPEERLRAVERIVLLACGTSWHAALVGKFVIERLTGVPVEVDYGSEYRYRDPVVTAATLAVVVTQSGETADTLAALREAHRKGAVSIAICNVVGSMATREADATVYTHAGPEIGVASTKAFTSQLVAFHLLALYLAQVQETLPPDAARAHLEDLNHLPRLLEQTLRCDEVIRTVARRFHAHRNFLYLGRGINYPIALEGALKLKEISYIHAEGYPAGEMKHGPLALIEEGLP